jgi:hypothetical protein
MIHFITTYWVGLVIVGGLIGLEFWKEGALMFVFMWGAVLGSVLGVAVALAQLLGAS